MNEVWSNPASWTSLQWMAVSILVLFIVAILVMFQRLWVIIKMSKKQKYTPNLHRLRKASQTDAKSASEGSDENGK